MKREKKVTDNWVKSIVEFRFPDMSAEEKKKIQFSVAVITYNEEQNLKDCIQSFHEIADEVIILDSFSTDKTEEIARSFPKVTFHVRKFSGHIEQKNHAIELCSGEWNLSLDADERVSPELCREIQDLLPRSDKKNGCGKKRKRF